ncbi:MAG: hypothetical protein AAGU05_16270 [Anaerolineaceae bacterium]
MSVTYSYTSKLDELEQSLARSLGPVKPNPKFVSDLDIQLHTRQFTQTKEKSLATAYLITSFGLFGGVFLFWLIRKLVRVHQNQGYAQAS